jgi:thioredoxin reductase
VERYDVTIVGGGPVGLFGAAMAGMHGLSAKVIESLPQLGGQLTALYPEKRIFDVAGFPVAQASEIARRLEEQAMRYSPAVHLGETATGLEVLADGGLRLRTDRGEHDTRTVLIAAGIGAFSPRPLPAAGADVFLGRGVYYIPPHASAFAGQTVVVVGGGDTAVDWTREIAGYAKEVVLVHRRAEFRALEGSVAEVRALDNVVVRTPCEVQEIGGNDAVAWVRLRDIATGGEEKVPARAVVSGLGFHAQVGPLKTWGMTFAGHEIPVEPSSMETNIPGVYAVGDIATYPGRLKLLALGFGEVGIAMARIRSLVHPHLATALPHSTSLENASSRAAAIR